MEQNLVPQEHIRLGAHGEDYGSKMSNPVFYIVDGIAVLAALMVALSFLVFQFFILDILFSVAAAAMLALLLWITWIRRQYASDGGGIMERVHRKVLSYLDFEGGDTLLEVGCGSGTMAILAVLMWPSARVVGVDYWGAVYNYSKECCPKTLPAKGRRAGVGFSAATPESWTF